MAKYNFEYKKHPEHKKTTLKRTIAWIAAFIYTIAAVLMVNINATDFKASIIGTNNVPAFNGTVSPIEKSPDWVAFNQSDYGLQYDQLASSKLINLPTYDASQLRTSTSSLTWGNAAHDAIRNAKITYSVPYLGSYELDGQELSGSHPAVDIKIPINTPVYAIANGEVTKTQIQSSGFGNHIVIKHPNVPSYANEAIKETLYSSYSHLKSISVSEGSIVKKGDLIGYSGTSGLSTTPHLHFQIDNDSAPWHPYWPFTSKEASDAGLNFTEAINTGFKQADAKAKTVNPMMYVQKYQNGTVNSVSTPTSTPEPDPEPVVVEPDPEPTPEPNPEPVVTTPDPDPEPETNENPYYNEKSITFNLILPDSFIKNEPFEMTIQAIDSAGAIVEKYNPNEAIRLTTSKGEAGINPYRLTGADFNNGIATATITPQSTNPLQIEIASEFRMKSSKTILEGSKNTLFADISDLHPNFQAIKFLKEEGVIQGYPDGSFKPTNSVSRVEVIKFILEGIDSELRTAKSLSFSDTDINQWYADYLYTAKLLGIVDGYPDGSFKPTASVNRVEFLKMLIEGMNVDIDPNDNITGFADVNRNQWFAPYVKFAKDKNLIDIGSSYFNPGKEMQRDEVAEAIYRVKVITETGSSQYTASLGDQLINNAG